MGLADNTYMLREAIPLSDGAAKRIDVRAFTRAVAFFGAGSLSVTPVADNAGTAISGASAENPANETIFDLKSLFIEAEMTGGDGTLILLM